VVKSALRGFWPWNNQGDDQRRCPGSLSHGSAWGKCLDFCLVWTAIGDDAPLCAPVIENGRIRGRMQNANGCKSDRRLFTCRASQNIHFVALTWGTGMMPWRGLMRLIVTPLYGPRRRTTILSPFAMICAGTRVATFFNASVLPTEVPPYFWRMSNERYQ